MELTEKQKELADKNYKLVKNFINVNLNQQEIPTCMREEFISDILWRFCISASKFEEDRGFKFSTFAKGGFSMGKRDILGRKIRAFKKHGFVPEKNIDKNEAKKEYEEVNGELLQHLIDNDKLTQLEKDMLSDYYINDFTLAQLGKKYHFTREWCRLVIKKGLQKLQKVIKEKKMQIEDFYETKID
jgi:hypothetical protein